MSSLGSLDVIRGTDDAALASAYTAARAAYLDELAAANLPTDIDNIDDATQHISFIFPSSTNLICTFTANATANTWGTWSEIVDSAATSLSTSFATIAGHITSMVIETLSDDNTIYMFQISYGDSNTIITEGRFAGGTKFQAPNNQKRFWPNAFLAGETIYYRMITATGVADTCTIHFRCHLHG